MAATSGKHGLFDENPNAGLSDDVPKAPGPASSEAATGFWSASLTQRQRVLLHILPLQGIKQSDAWRDSRVQYDTLALALKTFDVIIDHTGFGAQVNRDLLLQHLSPVLRAMDEAVSRPSEPAGHSDTVDRVIAALRNDQHRRQPFEVEYQDFDVSGASVRRILEFRLLTEEYGLDGSIVLVLTPEAINLYLRAFDLDIEDAQIANEAVVQSQIERGKFNEAIQSAQNARLQSVRYYDRISKLLLQTRRDVDKVDWRKDVPELLTAALQHAEGRLSTEQAILKAAEDRREELPAGSDRMSPLLEVIRLMRDCQGRHQRLHGQLMRARGDFLEQQARQSFSVRSFGHTIDLMRGVLQPALSLPREQSAQLAAAATESLCGAVAQKVASIRDLVEWHLRPRRPLPILEVPIDSPDMADHSLDVPRYTSDVLESTERILSAIAESAWLSDLLENLQGAGGAFQVQELLALQALQHFSREDEDSRAFFISSSADGRLAVPGFYGDDLLLQRNGVSHVR